MQDTTKTLGIIIGRFQPLHDGHKEIILKAKKLFDLKTRGGAGAGGCIKFSKRNRSQQ